VRRFRDRRTGRFLSASKAIDLRDGFQERRRADVDNLTRRLADQEITVQQWEAEMAALIRDLHAAQYVFGRGGLNAMTVEDWLAVDALFAEQQAYLRAFAERVAASQLSEAQIAARAKLYYGASRQLYEQGRASAFGVQLPAYPGQGSPCQANCACYWRLADKGDEVHATWVRTASESCSVCKRRASAWSPLVISKASDGRIARLWRAVA
jgi:uncharacterized coiled-coil protein SlyX